MKKEENNQVRGGLMRAVVADVVAAADPAPSGTSAFAKAMADRQPRSVLGGCHRRVRWALLGLVGPKKFMKTRIGTNRGEIGADLRRLLQEEIAGAGGGVSG